MLEMLAIALFIYTLRSHLARETGRLSVVLELERESPFHAGADVEGHETQGDN
jgi:hypothetical protein